MAITRSNSRLDATIDAGRTFFHQTVDNLRTARARRKVFAQTYHELSNLSDRELRDLGIPRSNIRRLAMEAAYDH